MPTSSMVMQLIRTFVEPVGENPTRNNPLNRDAARDGLLLRMTSDTFISEML